MKRDLEHDLEQELRRGARAVESDVPARVLTALHARLAREPIPAAISDSAAGSANDAAAPNRAHSASSAQTFAARAASASRSRRVMGLVAATVLIAGGLIWTYREYSPRGLDNVRPSSSSATNAAALLALPKQGFALAAHASAPLAREWENLKHDSEAVVRGLWRSVPPFVLRAN